MEIKRIILVTKFKGSSERALQRAMALARDHTAHLDILNVIDLPTENGNSVDEQVEALDHSLTELIDHEKTMRQIIEKAGKHKWTPEAHITLENPNATKSRLLSLNDKDFIVIGFGDWSDHLDLSPYIQPNAPADPPACPIWLVPMKSRKNLRKHLIIIADDTPTQRQFDNLERVCEMALKKQMSLDVLTISECNQQSWRDLLEKFGIEGYSMVNFETMEELLKFVDKQSPGAMMIMIQSPLSGKALRNMETFSRSDLIII